VLRDPATGLFPMWASEMGLHCGIDAWRSNSAVVHAHSQVGVRFERTGVVVPAFAHEPTVVRAPTGEWVMYYTGDPEGATPQPLCKQCVDGNTPANTTCGTGAAGIGPTFMIWAKSPLGPWSKPEVLFAAQANETNADTNLAVVILANGSAVGIARTWGPPTGVIAHLVLATHWRDASSYVGRFSTLLFPNTTIVPDSGLEDPFVYLDRRGVFHAVFHSQIEGDDERLCGGHAFSEDGITWTFGGTAWSNEVEFVAAEGSAAYKYSFSRRERPHLVFGDAADPYRITALTTGVQFGSKAPLSVNGEDACYTLLQRVK